MEDLDRRRKQLEEEKLAVSDQKEKVILWNFFQFCVPFFLVIYFFKTVSGWFICDAIKCGPWSCQERTWSRCCRKEFYKVYYKITKLIFYCWKKNGFIVLYLIKNLFNYLVNKKLNIIENYKKHLTNLR